MYSFLRKGFSYKEYLSAIGVLLFVANLWVPLPTCKYLSGRNLHETKINKFR